MTTTSLKDGSHLSKLFSEIIGKLGLEEIFNKRGRPYTYPTKSIIKAFLIMVAFRLTSVRSLARFLPEHPEIAKNCQFPNNMVPSYRTFCRRFVCLDSWILQWCRVIITFLIEKKVLKLKTLVIDSTPCKSKCRKPRKIGAKTASSDPEARFGSTNRGKEWFFGYKSMILATAEPLIVPLSWQVIPGNCNEVQYLISTISKAAWMLARDNSYELLADSGFDAQYNYDWCYPLNIRLTCPLNLSNRLIGKRLQRWRFYQGKQGQKLYQRRTDIERLNNHLKDIFLIDPFPVRRLRNVNTYLNLVMLCYLAGVYYNFINGRGLREIKSLIA